jgi:N-dimethylarginine dimethylaminohydrolase
VLPEPGATAFDFVTLPEAGPATPRHYLMCPPTYFRVDYAINPWMDPAAPVDPDLAMRQWEALRRTYEVLGHRVDLLDPVPGLPDMVFAANGALVVDGRVYGARFANAEREAEAPAHRAWFAAAGFPEVHEPEHVNEGEGDYAVTGRYILAGTGFRTHTASHREAQEFFGRPVVTLRLVDPRFYHLDTALAVLDDGAETTEVAYYPGAFDASSCELLRTLFPTAILASEADATAFGLNAVADGRHVILSSDAATLADQVADRGYQPVPVDLSELRKAGGGAKCCTLEIRS